MFIELINPFVYNVLDGRDLKRTVKKLNYKLFLATFFILIPYFEKCFMLTSRN